jgi:2'-5' RNA ligase
MNHFFALRPDLDTCERLAGIAERLRRWGLPATWVMPDDLHLTVLFLGPVDAEEAQWLPASAAPVAEAVRRPRLRLTGLGAWGSRNGGGQTVPRTVFAAVADAEESCKGLHADLSDVLDMPLEADFRPHVTLCHPQPRSVGDSDFPKVGSWPELLEAHGLAEWGEAVFESLVLYRSEADRTGRRRYAELASWRLIPA